MELSFTYKSHSTKKNDFNELTHHGVVGMKWGVRRYQNKDGSLTAAGRKKKQKEIDKVGKQAAKWVQSVNDFRNSEKTYINSKTGNEVMVYNSSLKRKAERNARKLESMLNEMKARNVKIKDLDNYWTKEGEAYSRLEIEEFGETFVSELRLPKLDVRK